MDQTAQSLWDDMATAALVGSERRAAPLPTAGGLLGAMLGAIAGQDVEADQKRLAAAAMVATYRRAGTRPEADHTAGPEPCPRDERPPTTARSSRHLRAMLDGPLRPALAEWLSTVAEVGRRIRNRDLVEVLELGREHPAMRALILPVIGGRGRWLAAQNPAWRFAAAGDGADVDWQTASREERLVELNRLRATEPARARELVSSTWSQETPADRAAFLATFATGLCAEDEPFLESALDDPRAEVRRAAAELLGRLPESLLGKRMIDRLRPLVTVLDRGGTLAIEVALPDAFSKDMARDGIARTQPGLGEKNAWLRQMIAIVPPSYWSGGVNRSPAELLESARRSEWESLLAVAWSEAAERHRDQPWLETIARKALAQQDLGRLRSSLAHIDREPRQRLLTDILAEGEPLMGHVLHTIVDAVPGPWDLAFSRAVVDRILHRLQTPGRMADPDIHSIVRLAGFAVATSLFDELVCLFPLDDPSWPPFLIKPVREFLDATRFRREALLELQS
jgi:hypothetical protein